MAVNGKIVQVIGSTFDVEFPPEHLPAIYTALKVDVKEPVEIHLVGEPALTVH